MRKALFLFITAFGLVAYSARSEPAEESDKTTARICRKAESYIPTQRLSPNQATLPTIPANVTPTIKVGNDFTVRGAMHHLRSRVHFDEINGKRASIVGIIVKTNYGDAPRCAVHRTGKGDPANCVAPVPTFWIADENGETSEIMAVMGWASNFAQIFTLIEAIDKAPAEKEREVSLIDEFWGRTLPNPVPNVGAKVRITGTYGITFTKASSGTAADPKHGILTPETIEYLEMPAEKAYLPGMKRKK